jgi:hypothetical protein
MNIEINRKDVGSKVTRIISSFLYLILSVFKSFLKIIFKQIRGDYE